MCGKKIKTIFSIIGAVLSVVLFTVLLFLLRRGNSDRRGSNGDTERDNRIKEGIAECEGMSDTIERETGECAEGITRAEDGITRCEGHLRRAEEILRRAVERSREKEQGS